MTIRYSIEPRLLPARHIAKRLGLSIAEFGRVLPELISQGFPAPDPTLGTFCLQAVDNWIDDRTGLQSNNNSPDPVAEMKSAIRNAEWAR